MRETKIQNAFTATRFFVWNGTVYKRKEGIYHEQKQTQSQTPKGADH